MGPGKVSHRQCDPQGSILNVMLYRQLGQVLMCGFDGTEVNDNVITLIEKHHVGNIFLAPKNLRCASIHLTSTSLA
jgi:hypothetical protein